ncbi:MAG: diguanylate cyclase, partial [Cyanobacteria bacterium J06650_10]
GHQAGDECLHTIAQALNQSTHRAGDFIARYGGEEFVIILPATSVQAALKFAALVHTRVAQENITHKTSAVSSCVTLSIGIAVGVPTPNLRAETALRFADEALYEAKNSGRNQSCQHMFNLTKLKQWPQQVIKAQ